MKRFAALSLALFFAAGPALAQTAHTPPPGSSERRAILDAVRARVVEHVGGRVEFVVTTLNVGGGWAYLEAEPQRPGGGEIPPDEFIGNNTTYAVLHREGGRWIVNDWTYGSTDAWWVAYCDGPGRIVIPDGC